MTRELKHQPLKIELHTSLSKRGRLDYHERLEHPFRCLSLGSSADVDREFAGTDLLTEDTKPEIRPHTRLPDELDLRVALHLTHVGDVLDDGHVRISHLMECWSLISHDLGTAWRVSRDLSAVESECRTDIADNIHSVSLRVIEIHVDVIDDVLRVGSVLRFKSGNDDVSRSVREYRHERSFSREVMQSRDVLDVNGIE